jgi:hypothetical protein
LIWTSNTLQRGDEQRSANSAHMFGTVLPDGGPSVAFAVGQLVMQGKMVKTVRDMAGYNPLQPNRAIFVRAGHALIGAGWSVTLTCGSALLVP